MPSIPNKTAAGVRDANLLRLIVLTLLRRCEVIASSQG